MSTEVCYILDYADCLHSFFENETLLKLSCWSIMIAANQKWANLMIFDD
jgi:hypothetical protein